MEENEAEEAAGWEDKGEIRGGMMLCVREGRFSAFHSKSLLCERGLLGNTFVLMTAKFGYDI